MNTFESMASIEKINPAFERLVSVMGGKDHVEGLSQFGPTFINNIKEEDSIWVKIKISDDVTATFKVSKKSTESQTNKNVYTNANKRFPEQENIGEPEFSLDQVLDTFQEKVG